MNNTRNKKLLTLVLAALFFALGYVLPFATGQIKEIGKMLCPMQLPVLLCGFICGPVWGLVVGAALPLLPQAASPSTRMRERQRHRACLVRDFMLVSPFCPACKRNGPQRQGRQ